MRKYTKIQKSNRSFTEFVHDIIIIIPIFNLFTIYSYLIHNIHKSFTIIYLQFIHKVYINHTYYVHNLFIIYSIQNYIQNSSHAARLKFAYITPSEIISHMYIYINLRSSYHAHCTTYYT